MRASQEASEQFSPAGGGLVPPGPGLKGSSGGLKEDGCSCVSHTNAETSFLVGTRWIDGKPEEHKVLLLCQQTVVEAPAFPQCD